MSHKYGIEAGAVFHQLGGSSGVVHIGIGLTFYIFDDKANKVVYCQYLSSLSAKQDKLNDKALLDGQNSNADCGFGKESKPIHPKKAINLDGLYDKNSPAALSIAEGDSKNNLIATVTIDDGKIVLPLRIFSSLESIGKDWLNTRGFVLAQKAQKTTSKNHHPKIEKSTAHE